MAINIVGRVVPIITIGASGTTDATRIGRMAKVWSNR